MDAHIDTDMTQQEVQADLMRAADQASQMRGTVPSEIEGMLGELKKPVLKFTDIVRSALLKKVQDAGLNNDWHRLRRRYLQTSPRQYLPKRYMHKPRWLAMLDTSGSMGDDDMAYGISQLQVLGSNTEGYVIPCDAQPHWAGVHKVEKADDLKRTKVVGRGGTVFDEFFRDFPKYLGTEFDVIIVLTDGDCGVVPLELRPKGIDVVWVLTRGNTSFRPSFGRVAPLRHDRP
jgi:predicted metal-dependent peptidase